MLDEQQIRNRRPLWSALSGLWLDTELSEEDLERIARVMADSGLTIDQLREVYLVEVAPVVSPNLLSVAGEWTWFDQDWLCSQILRNLRDRPRRTRFWSWFPLTRGPMLYATERHWKRLVELVQRYRDQSARDAMTKLRVQSFAISIDGYGAGPHQDLQNPLGVGGPELMEWFFHTRLWRRMHGHDDGETGVDNGIAEQGFAGIGAWILGRNMFGPVRGPWPDDSWKGWWGDEPPYHTPVFVLTHHPRAPLKMAGGTEFRFVTEGIHAALEQATAAAQGRDVRLGGGVSTVRQYLRAALVDELHLAIRPFLLGRGEHLLNDIDMRALGYECANYVAGERATHVFLRKRE